VVIDGLQYCGVNCNTKNEHLLALEMTRYKYNKIVIDLGTEGFDIVENGLELIVKSIADELNIRYTDITFKSVDLKTKSNVFQHLYQARNIDILHIDIPVDPIDLLDNKYGLFCGRSSNERMYAFHKHLTWEHKQRGLVTYHLNPYDHDINLEEGFDHLGFITEFPDRWLTVYEQLPYNNVNNDYLRPPIIHIENNNQTFWKKVYSEVSVEIVCETVVSSDTFFITEKILRPIAYGRMFLVIGPNDFEKNLKSLGFDTFDDVIDKSYDSGLGYTKIDKIYQSLNHVLHQKNLVKKLETRLAKNKELLIELKRQRAGE